MKSQSPELLDAGVSEFRWTPAGRSGPWAKYRVEKPLRDRAVLIQGTKFSPGTFANPIRLGEAPTAADMRYFKKVQEAFGPAFKAPVLKLKKFAVEEVVKKDKFCRRGFVKNWKPKASAGTRFTKTTYRVRKLVAITLQRGPVY